MSDPDFEKIADAQKASAEVVMAIMRTSFEGMQRLAALNMAAAQEALSSTATATSKLASSKNMADLSGINRQIEPEHMMKYWRNVYDLVSSMQKDVTAVMQANYTQLAKSVAASVGQNKPSSMNGGDMITGAMQSMMEQTNKAFANMSAIADQMTRFAGANQQAAAPTKGNEAEPATKRTGKK